MIIAKNSKFLTKEIGYATVIRLTRNIIVGDKIVYLPEYFFTCLNMTDLVGKFHVLN